MLEVERHASLTLFGCKPAESDEIKDVLMKFDVQSVEDDEDLDNKVQRLRFVVEATWKFENRTTERPHVAAGLAAVLAFNDMAVYDAFIQDMLTLLISSAIPHVDIVTYVLNFNNIPPARLVYLTDVADVPLKDWLRFYDGKPDFQERRRKRWEQAKCAVLFDTISSKLKSPPSDAKSKKSRKDGELQKAIQAHHAVAACGVYGPEDILVFGSERMPKARKVRDDLMITYLDLKELELVTAIRQS